MQELEQNYMETRKFFKQAEDTLVEKLPDDISPQGYMILTRLAVAKAPQKGDLARFMNVTLPQITALTNILSRRGYINEKPSKKDQRRTITEISAKGLELVTTLRG